MSEKENYLLAEIVEVGDATELLCRFLEVERSDASFRIVSSESDYLGDEAISGEIFEEGGETCLRFECTEEAGKRTFFAEVFEDDWDYIQGEVMEDKELAGKFVLRKVP